MNRIKTIRLLNILILPVILIMMLSCEKIETAKGSIYAFSTFIDISVTSTNAKSDCENIKDIFNDIHKLCDSYNEYDGINNVYTINKERTNVEISEDLKEILSLCNSLKEETDNYFNFEIGSLSLLYKTLIDSGKEEDIPSSDVILNELTKMNNTSLHFNDNKVTLEGEGLIDLGAIGKGYALKKVKEYLDTNNIKTYLINAGSSSILIGEKEGSKEYRVGVREVDDLVLERKNKAIGTSSLLEQCITINDVIYHHIINPFTGKNDHYYDTVVVVGSDPVLMDVYSTVLFMMPKEEIIEVINHFEVEEIYLCKDKKVIYEYPRGVS